MCALKFPPPGRPFAVEPLPAALAALLTGGVAMQLALPGATQLPELLSGRARVSFTVAPATIPAVADPVINTRPLFSPTRTAAQPASKAGTPGVQAPLTIADYALAGTAVARGSAATAAFRLGSGQTVTVRVGERIAGWRLAAVARDGVAITRGRARRALRVGQSAAPITGIPAGAAPIDEQQQPVLRPAPNPTESNVDPAS